MATRSEEDQGVGPTIGAHLILSLPIHSFLVFYSSALFSVQFGLCSRVQSQVYPSSLSFPCRHLLLLL